MFRISLALCALLLLVAAVSCSGSGSSTSVPDSSGAAPATVPAGIDLPAPSTLPRNVSGPPSDDNRLTYGTSFYPSYPANLIVQEDIFSEVAILSPEYSAPDNLKLNKAAYGTYVFANMDGYSGPAQVQTRWDVAPTDWNNLYIGMANFSRDSWDFFATDSAGVAALPGWGPYIDADGDVIAVILVLGTDSCKLRNVVLGGSAIYYLLLHSDIDTDPTQNIAPLTVNFTSSIYAVGGEITGMDWDFDNDGTPEVTGDFSEGQQHTYNDPGLYTCKLTLTMSDGNSVSDTLTLTAVNPANNPPVANLTGDFSVGDAPLPVLLDASGSTDDGSIIRYEWDFDEDGKYERTTTEPTTSYTFMRNGATVVTVRVTDNDYATDTAQYFIFLDSGFHTTVIDASANVLKRMSLGVQGTGIDARACLAYIEWDGDDLFFSRAITDIGHLWTAPVLAAPAELQVVESPSIGFRTATGRPQVAFQVYDVGFQSDLYFVEAGADDGSTWNAPVPVDTEGNFGFTLALATANSGNPAIAAVRNGISQSLGFIQYFEANDVSGTTWKAPVDIGNAGGDGTMSGMAMLIDGGLPLISFYKNASPSYIAVYSAANVNGTAWDPFDNVSSIYSQPAALLQVDGRPAMACGVNAQNNKMLFLRADDSAGKSWSAEPQQLVPDGEGGEVSMAIVNGVPVLAYMNWNTRSLMYLTAMDATGSAWNEPLVIDSVTSVGSSVSIVSCNNFPVICYTDAANDKVLAASWY